MRIEIVEYGIGIEISELLKYGGNLHELYSSIETANRRIKRNLDCSRDVLVINEGRLRACGIAGIVRLTNQIEIEIVPKFLGQNNDSSWQGTLYLLSVMSKHGAVLANEHILSSTSYLASLYDIAGRMLAQGYQKHRRKLIRKYRKEVFFDYAIDGEIDFDAITEQNQDGRKQTRVKFDIFNGYNATIAKAMKIALPYVTDNSVRNILSTAISVFGRQALPPTNKLPVPSRNKEWNETYMLAYDIVNGLSNSFDSGRVLAPGFVANTWQLWEWLLTAGISIGNQNNIVKSQEATKWGEKINHDRPVAVNVYPDITIRKSNGNQVEYMIDAKYKTLSNPATGEIARDDLYEAFAFCSATGANKLLLAYPADNHANVAAGTVKKQAEYFVDGKKIIVVTIAFGTINQRGGLYAFGRNMQSGINGLVDESYNTEQEQQEV